jgi:hypothetical protein
MRGDSRAFGLRDDASADDNLRGRNAGRSGPALPAAASASSTTAATADGLPGRDLGAGRHRVPDAAAATAAAAAVARR